MKHILVTGGAKGIGRAIVEELAAHEYKVTATYNGSKAAAEEIAKQFPSVSFVAVDLQDRQALERFIDGTSKAEPIDVLVNNAGVYVGKPFAKMSADEVYQQTDLNFTALARLTHGLLSSLKKTDSPLVINISSQASHGKLTGEAMYSAVKAAVSTLSYVLRAELNPEGVRVTAIEPYGVNTYGIPEPSNMVLPSELAEIIRDVIEKPSHLQLDTIVVSHIKQDRADYPEWIEQ